MYCGFACGVLWAFGAGELPPVAVLQGASGKGAPDFFACPSTTGLAAGTGFGLPGPRLESGFPVLGFFQGGSDPAADKAEASRLIVSCRWVVHVPPSLSLPVFLAGSDSAERRPVPVLVAATS